MKRFDTVTLMKLNRNKIEIELKRLGWSQSELARRMGIHRQQINRLMQPANNGITLQTIDKVADALGIPAKDLIK